MVTENSPNTIGKNTSPKSLNIPAEVAASSRAQTSTIDQEAVPRRTEAEKRAYQLIESEGLNQAEKISSVAAGKTRDVEMVQPLAVEKATIPDRETLCIKVGEMMGEDLAEFTIYSMLDIEHSDAAMITRVKDLVFCSPHLADNQLC